MITRREVIASGLAVTFLARASAASLGERHPATAARAVRLFLADERFPQARAAARAAEASGPTIVMFAGDVTGLYQSLDLAWRSGPFAIAGFTTRNALFVIERLGWERGLRTIYRGIHRRAANGDVQHELPASSPMRSVSGIHSVPDWPTKLGAELAGWTPDAIGSGHIPTSLTVPSADGTTLASWLLAPKDEVGRSA